MATSRRPTTGRSGHAWPVRSRTSANPGLPFRAQSGKSWGVQRRAFDTLDAASLIVRQRAEAVPWDWPDGGSSGRRARKQRTWCLLLNTIGQRVTVWTWLLAYLPQPLADFEHSLNVLIYC